MDQTIEHLGTEELDDLEDTPFEGYDILDWVRYFIDTYGGIDGSHHKQWVIDQCSRILRGTPVNVSLAKWSNGETTYRVITGEPSYEYLEYVKAENGFGYEVDEGVAP